MLNWIVWNGSVFINIFNPYIIPGYDYNKITGHDFVMIAIILLQIIF